LIYGLVGLNWIFRASGFSCPRLLTLDLCKHRRRRTKTRLPVSQAYAL
jgi:hypothetical protein